MSIKIKNKVMTIPIVQGGMGIGISMGKLAGTIAREGGMGTISFVNCGYENELFSKNPKEANKIQFLREVEIAKKISDGKGIIMVNIMSVVNNLEEYLKFINTTEIDGVVVGAGLPLELPKFIDKSKIIAPIVSSARALNIIFKIWIKKYNRKPDFIVFEGPKAGGHLGFREKELNIDIWKELNKIIQVRHEYDNYEEIPIFIGGGFGSSEKIKEAIKYGANGVQIGTGFLLTKESSLEINVKEKIIKGVKEDKLKICLLKSPVGLLARGLCNNFVKRTKTVRVPAEKCMLCISTCTPKTTPYCISEALIRAVKGDIENGLFFVGEDIVNFSNVTPAKDYIDKILGEIKWVR